MPALAVEEVVAQEWGEDGSLHDLVDIVSLAVGVPGMSQLCFIPWGKGSFQKMHPFK